MSFCTVYGSSLFGIDCVENEADSLFFLALLSVIVFKNKGGKAGSLLRQGVAGG